MGVCSLDDVLFPGMYVRMDEVVFTADVLSVSAVACDPPPRCPSCRAGARRVHSSYERGLAERPVTGRKLQIRLRVRRFFCDRTSCRRRTFVEQAPGSGCGPSPSSSEDELVNGSAVSCTWLRAVASCSAFWTTAGSLVQKARSSTAGAHGT